jgi:hypothetical protein
VAVLVEVLEPVVDEPPLLDVEEPLEEVLDPEDEFVIVFEEVVCVVPVVSAATRGTYLDKSITVIRPVVRTMAAAVKAYVRFLILNLVPSDKEVS